MWLLSVLIPPRGYVTRGSCIRTRVPVTPLLQALHLRFSLAVVCNPFQFHHPIPSRETQASACLNCSRKTFAALGSLQTLSSVLFFLRTSRLGNYSAASLSTSLINCAFLIKVKSRSRTFPVFQLLNGKFRKHKRSSQVTN